MRAVVAGAGFAGLAAADALARCGADVVVFEARDRVGGRVWSRELGNGAVVEMGAEFVLPGNDVLLGLVERFGLGLWDKGMRYGLREPRGVDVDAAGLERAAAAVASALAEGRGAGLSAAALLGALDLEPVAREALLARCEVSAGNSAQLVDAAALGHVAAVSDEPCPSVAGGNQRVAAALAGELGDAVVLSTPVDRVAWSDGRVRVRAGGAEVEADACVVAVPASVVGRIAFEPPLPAAVAQALAGVVYGQAAKLFVPLSVAPPTSAVLSVPERYWTWTATGAADAVQPVVSAFAGSPGALEALDVASGPARWLESLARLRPDLPLLHDGVVLSRWDDDPWVQAAYSTHVPGGGSEVLTEPCGPLVFAGEHTAGDHAALMEGALRSGLRAAGQVLTRQA